MRAIVTGDWHVGAGMDYAVDRLADQRRTIERIVDVAIENDVDALFLLGDLWHRRRPTPAELLVVWEPLRRLHAELGCDVLAINGNHCVEAFDGPVALDLFADFIDVHRQPGIWNTRGCAVATLPWSPASRLIAARGGGDRDALHSEAAALLLATARGLRADIPDDQPAVLLLHWSVTEAVTPTGREVGPDFGIALPVEQIEALGFDAVLMGHIHKFQRLDQSVDVGEERPFLYTGSPAPVDFGEDHVEHGVVLLDVGETIRPHHVHADFLPIESRPFVTLDYDWREAALDRDPVAEDLETEKVADAVVRVRYDVTEAGARRIDQGELRRRLYEAGAHKVFQIAATVERADRARVAGVDEELAPLSALDLWLQAEQLDGLQARSLRELTSRYLEAVGA